MDGILRTRAFLVFPRSTARGDRAGQTQGTCFPPRALTSQRSVPPPSVCRKGRPRVFWGEAVVFLKGDQDIRTQCFDQENQRCHSCPRNRSPPSDPEPGKYTGWGNDDGRQTLLAEPCSHGACSQPGALQPKEGFPRKCLRIPTCSQRLSLPPSEAWVYNTGCENGIYGRCCREGIGLTSSPYEIQGSPQYLFATALVCGS